MAVEHLLLECIGLGESLPFKPGPQGQRSWSSLLWDNYEISEHSRLLCYMNNGSLQKIRNAQDINCDNVFLLDEGPKTSECSVYSASITNANIQLNVFQFYMTECTCVIFSGTMYANGKHNIQKGSEINDTPLPWQCGEQNFEKCVVRQEQWK